MTSLIPWLEKTLGPTAPHKMAHRSAPAPRKVVVFTASGDQGRSVCDSLVSSGRFIVTGITKYPQSIAADSLKAKGVKIVKGDIADTATFVDYLEGQDAAFVNMDYLETFQHLGPDMKHTITLEIRQSVAAVEACKRAGIKHIVYSALDDLPEELHVPHYASKAKVVEHIRAAQLPCTILYPSHPYSDILAWDLLRPNESHTGLILAIPAPDDCTIPGYAVEQVGDWVSVAMLKPHKWIGKELRACAERPSVTSMARDLAKLLKVPVDTLHLTKEEFYSTEHRQGVGEAIWAQYRACYEEALQRDPVQSEKIAPRQWSFKQWATQSKEIREMAQEIKVDKAH